MEAAINEGKAKYCLEMLEVSKNFPGVKALNKVTLQIKPGEVHALLGENGAGKSTLMKILSGQYSPDEGKIIYLDEEIKIKNSSEAIKLGISMIHQELSPLKDMTVAENLFIGREPRKKGLLNKKKMNEKATEYLKEYELDVKVNSKVRELNIAQMQMLEIIRAATYNSEIVIMDEPTSSLTDEEVRILFRTIRSLQSHGVSIIYISHRIEEIFEIADRATVFRDGQYIGTKIVDETDRDELISMMVGRSVEDIFPKVNTVIKEKILEVKNLTRSNVFKDVSFDLRRGEILGFAGLIGAGRSEVMNSIFGIDKSTSGEILLEGEPVSIKNPRAAIGHGIGYVTEDRKGNGLVLIHSVLENISLPTLSRINKGVVLNKRSEMERGTEYIKKLNVKTPAPRTPAGSLSGGNQQKLVIAKWMMAKPRILILDEPTRGIDVGAKAEIYTLMCKLVAEGMAIILISSEMPEVMSMCDRLIVMGNGRIKAEFSRQEILDKEITQEKVLSVAIGGEKGE